MVRRLLVLFFIRERAHLCNLSGLAGPATVNFDWRLRGQALMALVREETKMTYLLYLVVLAVGT